MNNLSWIIYWAGAADGLSVVSGFMAFVFFVLSAGSVLWYMIIACNTADKEVLGSKPYQVSFRRWSVTGLMVFTTLYFFLPTRQTIILIAGSEMGERVLKSEQVQGIIDPGLALVQQWIKNESDKMLKDAKGNK